MNVFALAFVLASPLLFHPSLPARASQLQAQEAETLAAAKYVFVGRVTTAAYDQKAFAGTMKVEVLDSLKGKLEPNGSLEIAVDKNPLSGFGVLLNKGDVAVFFLREVRNGKATLAAPGAAAVLSREYFK